MPPSFESRPKGSMLTVQLQRVIFEKDPVELRKPPFSTSPDGRPARFSRQNLSADNLAHIAPFRTEFASMGETTRHSAQWSLPDSTPFWQPDSSRVSGRRQRDSDTHSAQRPFAASGRIGSHRALMLRLQRRISGTDGGGRQAASAPPVVLNEKTHLRLLLQNLQSQPYRDGRTRRGLLHRRLMGTGRDGSGGWI